MGFRPRYLTIAAADVAGTVTVLVLLVPSLHFAYRSLPLHAALETAAGMTALVAAYLVLGRYRYSRSSSDLALFGALATLALSNLLFAATPWTLAGEDSLRFSTWMTLIGSLTGSLLLAAAAFGPEGRVRRPIRSAALTLLVITMYFLFIGLAVWATHRTLPLGIDPGIPRPPAKSPWSLVARPVLTTQFVAAIAFAVAAVGFTRRAERGDDFMTWLGASAALAGFARFNYGLFPSLYSEWVYIGDVLRLGSYVLILTGAAREISRYQRRVAEAAVLEERRRIARDMHDGLSQELAFIATQGRSLRRRPELLTLAPELGYVTAAAERALDESRRAIAALSHPVDEPFDVTLVQAVEEIAERMGSHARFAVDPGVQVSPETREALLRIVREAVTNASRHGGAGTVTVELSNGDGIRLRIADDGSGFDPDLAAAKAEGFGLVTMRERADAVGAQLRISSAPREGTEIEVVLP